MTDYKTDALGFTPDSKGWDTLNIHGQTVEVRRIERTENIYGTKRDSRSLRTVPNYDKIKGTKTTVWFNAYVELKGSESMSDTYLGYPTFRKGAWLGVDTNHAFNQNQSEAEKLRSALGQIDSVIESWKKVTQEGYYGTD